MLDVKSDEPVQGKLSNWWRRTFTGLKMSELVTIEVAIYYMIEVQK